MLTIWAKFTFFHVSLSKSKTIEKGVSLAETQELMPLAAESPMRHGTLQLETSFQVFPHELIWIKHRREIEQATVFRMFGYFYETLELRLWSYQELHLVSQADRISEPALLWSHSQPVVVERWQDSAACFDVNFAHPLLYELLEPSLSFMHERFSSCQADDGFPRILQEEFNRSRFVLPVVRIAEELCTIVRGTNLCGFAGW